MFFEEFSDVFEDFSVFLIVTFLTNFGTNSVIFGSFPLFGCSVLSVRMVGCRKKPDADFFFKCLRPYLENSEIAPSGPTSARKIARFKIVTVFSDMVFHLPGASDGLCCILFISDI